MEKQGVIYILTNPSFPQYIKIGYADDMKSRLAAEAFVAPKPEQEPVNK